MILGTVPGARQREVVRSTATMGLPTDDRVAVRPGDSSTADAVEIWLRDKERTVQLCRAADELQQALGRSPTTVELADHLAAPGPREEPEDLLALAELIAELPELEHTVIMLRFCEDLDQSSIAARIGYSQMQVSRLLRRALARVRTQLLEP
jgi:RNA polymerase sigma factor (sigma-70 family)